MSEVPGPYGTDPIVVTTDSHDDAAAAIDTQHDQIRALVEELLRDAEPGYMLRQEVMHTGFITARECWEGYQAYVRRRLAALVGNTHALPPDAEAQL